MEINRNTPIPAHRVTNDIPEDDFVNTVTPPATKVSTKSTKTKKKKPATAKKSAPDPPSAPSPETKVCLSQRLVDAGLTPITKHELSDSHIAKVRQARK